MNGLTLHQLRCFDAVVLHGSFQAAADQLCRSQPTVFAAVKSLEAQLGLGLLDRSSYRISVTPAGRSFHDRVQVFLREFEKLETHATQLVMGVETQLRVVVGDLCPLPQTLGLLRKFFNDCPGTQLHLHCEAISGPWERLHDGDADLIFHHVDTTDPRLEHIAWQTVQLIPVVAPDFLDFAITDAIAPEHMQAYAQCIIRDSARHSEQRDYYVMDGVRNWTVSDQLMKKEIILQGMGWGHMPDFLVQDELRAGRLLSIAGKHLRGGAVDLVAARKRQVPHGPVAQWLWRYLQEQLPSTAFATNQE